MQCDMEIALLLYLHIYTESVKAMSMEKNSTVVLGKNKALFEIWK